LRGPFTVSDVGDPSPLVRFRIVEVVRNVKSNSRCDLMRFNIQFEVMWWASGAWPVVIPISGGVVMAPVPEGAYGPTYVNAPVQRVSEPTGPGPLSKSHPEALALPGPRLRPSPDGNQPRAHDLYHDLPAIMSMKEVAAETGFSKSFVKRLVASGELRSFKLSSRVVRIRKEDVIQCFTDPARQRGGRHAAR